MNRLAGLALPLSAVRGARDPGIGELPDLVPFAEWCLSLGQRIIGLLPLGESAPGEPSPYSALSSFALDPLYVSVAEIPELEGVEAPAPQGGGTHLDRERVYARKRPLFERGFERFDRLPAKHERRLALDAFRAEHAAWLEEYALFRALCDEEDWRSWLDWPRALRDREPRAVEEARSRLAREIRFYEWLQLVAEEQWDRTRARLSALGVLVYGDLPFAPGVHSADVWANREAFDVSRTAGAPPDAFSETGQRWGLPMFDWPAQRASDWRWLRARTRRMRELYDVVRVDHVVGLFRTYGFRDDDEPGAFDPAEEDEQVAQGREILELMRDEVAPARLVAEDLGSIPPFVRETLRDLDVPGYAVFRWQTDEDENLLPPSAYPECSLATTGTHDTDVLVTWWRAADPEERTCAVAAIGLSHEPEGGELSEETRLAILEALWASPSRYVVLPIQDLFGWAERVNVPATVGGTNWRWRLPTAIADLPRDPRLATLVRRAKR